MGGDKFVAAGIATICVLTGGTPRASCAIAGAAAVYESVEELRHDLANTPLS